MAQDSSRPEFWDTRYAARTTPWDAQRVPPLLTEWIARAPHRGRVLVPGCGSGYEVRAFAEAGFEVEAIDFSAEAVAAARQELGPLARLVRQADFFAFAGDDVAFDVVYERALLCALPRSRWQDWARRMAALLAPGGVLAGFYYFDDNARGPPFGIDAPALQALLDPGFLPVDARSVPPEHSLRVFAGKEHWQVWRRRASL